MIPLPKYDHCFLARTDPKDVARVESKTVICSKKKIETIPEPAEGVTGQLGYWISPEELDAKIHTLFPGAMKGDWFITRLLSKLMKILFYGQTFI